MCECWYSIYHVQWKVKLTSHNIIAILQLPCIHRVSVVTQISESSIHVVKVNDYSN